MNERPLSSEAIVAHINSNIVGPLYSRAAFCSVLFSNVGRECSPIHLTHMLTKEPTRLNKGTAGVHMQM